MEGDRVDETDWTGGSGKDDIFGSGWEARRPTEFNMDSRIVIRNCTG